MPVQYSSVLGEARAVREHAGLFDLGHMGRIRIAGADAEAFLQRLQTNDVAKIGPGQIRYALILDERGITQDDILVYREPEPDEKAFFMVVNAANTEADLEIMRHRAAGFSDVQIIDQTAESGMVAIQGPESQAITQKLTDIDLAGLKYYHWTRGRLGGVDVGLSRTGYTGEDGFEVYVPQEHTGEIWDAFLEAGADAGLVPVGLAARDILRLEAGMALFGHELDDTTNPLEARLGWAVKWTHDFVGREALEKVKEAGPARLLVGLTTPAKRVPRQGYALYDGDEKIGAVCSGGASPTLGKNIATAYVTAENAEVGKDVSIDMRGRREPATIATLPFYKRAK